MKKCSNCNSFKELSEFGKDKHRKDNLNVYCKICVRKFSREKSPFRKKRKYDPIKAKIQREKNPERIALSKEIHG